MRLKLLNDLEAMDMKVRIWRGETLRVWCYIRRKTCLSATVGPEICAFSYIMVPRLMVACNGGVTPCITPDPTVLPTWQDYPAIQSSRRREGTVVEEVRHFGLDMQGVGPMVPAGTL